MIPLKPGESPTPLISVIIPHYGDANPTGTLVEDLQGQEGAPNFEIVVVDDHSPVPFRWDSLQNIIRSPANRGFASTVNLGAAHARGTHLLILNSDLRVPPTFLKRFVEGYLHVQPAMATCRVHYENGEEQPMGKRQPRLQDAFLLMANPLARYRGTTLFAKLIGEFQGDWPWVTTLEGFLQLRILPAFSGVVTCIPSEAFWSLGGFDERFYMYYEEMDLQRRAATNGLKRVQLSDPQVTHALGARSERAWGWMHESRFLYFAIWGGMNRAKLLEEAALLINFFWNSARVLKGRSNSPVSEYWIARKKLAHAVRHAKMRKQLKNLRVFPKGATEFNTSEL